MNFPKSYTRTIVSVINFDVTTFFDSEHYKKFVESNPKLKDELDDLISEFVKWAESPRGDFDQCFKVNKQLPVAGSWREEDRENDLLIAFTTDDFEPQMGTTHEKFSLTKTSDLPNVILLRFANVFAKIGFKTFVAKFMIPTGCVAGYDYSFTSLEDFEWETYSDLEPREYIHICVTV